MCPAVVPCATADEESGSSLKLGSCVDQPFVSLGTRKLVLEMFSFKWTLAKESAFRKLNLGLILDLSCALYSIFTPSVGVIGLAEYICTHPILNFTEEDPDFIPEDVEEGTVLHPALPVD